MASSVVLRDATIILRLDRPVKACHATLTMTYLSELRSSYRKQGLSGDRSNEKARHEAGLFHCMGA